MPIQPIKTVAIVQSNYLPWKGYFDLIASVDEFIIYDDMQYTRRDWRNRNKLKTPNGLEWITVPVKVKGQYLQTIRETQIDGTAWTKKHWKAFETNYRRAAHYNEIAEILRPHFFETPPETISDLNRKLISTVCKYLRIETVLSSSSDYSLISGKTERLAELCRQAGAKRYISGPAARDYIEPTVFANYGIKLDWFTYERYPEYPQLWGDFIHGVSIVDLLFNCGQSSINYFRRNP